MRDLTAKQRRFVEEYLVDLNATQAAIRAGYATNSASVEGSRLLANAKVQEVLGEAQRARSKRTEITADWVLERLVENADRSMQAVEVTVDGALSGEFRYEGSVANRSLELIGKHLGMFVERKEVGRPGDFSNLADDELQAEIEREAEAVGFVAGEAPAAGKSGSGPVH